MRIVCPNTKNHVFLCEKTPFYGSFCAWNPLDYTLY